MAQIAQITLFAIEDPNHQHTDVLARKGDYALDYRIETQALPAGAIVVGIVDRDRRKGLFIDHSPSILWSEREQRRYLNEIDYDGCFNPELEGVFDVEIPPKPQPVVVDGDDGENPFGESVLERLRQAR